MFNISSYSQFLAVKIQDENDWQWIIHLAEDDWGDVGLKLEHLGFYSSAQEEESGHHCLNLPHLNFSFLILISLTINWIKVLLDVASSRFSLDLK